MKAFPHTLPQKAGSAEAADAKPGSAANAIRQTHGAPGESAPPAQGGEDAARESTDLALELGDFIARIPPRLLKLGKFDPHQPLLFDLGGIAERINRGVFTIPLADLLKRVPEIFVDDAEAQRTLEIWFPWQRVTELIIESEAAGKKSEGETLRQKLRRQLKAGKPAARAAVPDAPVETKQANPAAVALEVPKVPESAPPIFELPESKQPNFPSQSRPPAIPAPVEQAGASPASSVKPISDLMDLSSAPPPPAHSGKAGTGAGSREPVSGSAKSGVEESEQKMNKARIAFLEAQLKALASKHHNEVSVLRAKTDRLVEKVQAATEKERLNSTAALSLEEKARAMAAMESELESVKAERDRTAGLLLMAEEQTDEIAARFEFDLFALRVESAHIVAEARDNADRKIAEMESRLAQERVSWQSEREHAPETLISDREQPLASVTQSAAQEAELEMRTRSAEQFEADIAEYRARIKTMLAERSALARTVEEQREKHANELDAVMQDRAQLQAGHEKALCETTGSGLQLAMQIDSLQEQVRSLLEERENTAATHASATAALRAELEAHTADFEARRAAAEQAEARRPSPAATGEGAESGLSEARTELERERQQVVAERRQLLREMTARAETATTQQEHAGQLDATNRAKAEAEAKIAASTAERDAARSECKKAEELAAAQAAAHERVAAQWEADIETYRKRLQLLIGERAALAAKLREAEIALQTKGGSAIGTAA